MCLAIYKPAGVEIPADRIARAHTQNPDGFGYSYPADSGECMMLAKGVFTREAVLAMARDIPKEKPALIHFRFATVGEINRVNSHPFAFSDWAMVHNGPQIAPGFGNAKISDSRDFAHKLAEFPFTSIKSAKDRLLANIAAGNKVAFLSARGECVILREELGTWKDGAWYSNECAFPREYAPIWYSSSRHDDEPRYARYLDDNDDYGIAWEPRADYKYRKPLHLQSTLGQLTFFWIDRIQDYYSYTAKSSLCDAVDNGIVDIDSVPLSAWQ